VGVPPQALKQVERIPPPAALRRAIALPSASTSPACGGGAVCPLQLLRTTYLAFSARLSKKTPCSPNMFQNHQGRFTRSGRP
jgi:hypothetical protein